MHAVKHTALWYCDTVYSTQTTGAQVCTTVLVNLLTPTVAILVQL